MTVPYTFLSDLPGEAEPPHDGILSRAIFNDDHAKVVLFGFGADQELSEHTAAAPAIVQVLQGEAVVTLGADVVELRPGAWLHMPAGLAHSVHARGPTVLLLTLLKG